MFRVFGAGFEAEGWVVGFEFGFEGIENLRLGGQ